MSLDVFRLLELCRRDVPVALEVLVLEKLPVFTNFLPFGYPGAVDLRAPFAFFF